MANPKSEYGQLSARLLRLGLAGLLLATALPSPLHAHGFGQRYDLPLPLWLYLLGAGATVGLSFVVVAVLGRVPRSGDRRLRVALPSAGMVGRSIGSAIRIASVGLFALVIVAGLVGNQSPFKNIAPTMVWVIGWVGLSFAAALIGDLWTVINPWDAVARFVERSYQRRRQSSSVSPLLSWLDAWAAVALFLVFAWCELIWDGSDRPRSVALALLAYSAVTWAGMLVFGRSQWLR